jgi:hypothetical protein
MAIQPGALTTAPGRLCRVWPDERAPVLEGDPEPHEGEAGGEAGGDVGRGETEMTSIDHLEQLELQGREGGQGATDAGGEKGVREAVLWVVAEAGDEVAEAVERQPC